MRSRYIFHSNDIFIRSKRLSTITSTSAKTFSLKLESDVASLLRSVQEPLTKSPLGFLNSINKIDVSTERVSIHLTVPIIGYPLVNELLEACRQKVLDIKSIKNVEFSLSPPPFVRKPHLKDTGLANVRHIIAVSSCKGGVGKSTIAVNLASELARRGLSVGLLDADVYGPSIPVMVPTQSQNVRKSTMNEKFVLPLEGPNRLRVLSFGHVNPRSGATGSGGRQAALMRGPIASKVINQLCLMTDWGQLDYLIVDLPPGTGDIQLTLCQTINFDGAVVITTPHILSVVDTVKGLEMFADLQVPVVSIVENMSHFQGDDGKLYYPFGKGGRESISQALEIKGDKYSLTPMIQETPYHSLPISPVMSSLYSKSIEEFEKFQLSRENSEFKSLADSVISQLFLQRMRAQLIPSISYQEKRGIVLRYFTTTEAKEYSIPVSELRNRAPNTGLKLEGNHRQFDDTIPTRFELKGNYGVAIHWSDGHFADIYPYAILRQIADDLLKQTN